MLLERTGSQLEQHHWACSEGLLLGHPRKAPGARLASLNGWVPVHQDYCQLPRCPHPSTSHPSSRLAAEAASSYLTPSSSERARSLALSSQAKSDSRGFWRADRTRPADHRIPVYPLMLFKGCLRKLLATPEPTWQAACGLHQPYLQEVDLWQFDARIPLALQSWTLMAFSPLPADSPISKAEPLQGQLYFKIWQN